MSSPHVSRSAFGTTSDGVAVDRWRLDSGNGVRAAVLTYGAILHTFETPDREGRAANIVLSLPTLDDYAAGSSYLGAVVGRFANRIAHGRFTLDGVEHRIPVNDRGHALHGGPQGFDRRVWRAEPVSGADSVGVRLGLVAPDGDMGFPGRLDVEVTYTLDTRGVLALDYRARTDRPTVLNLTNHSYFNLTTHEVVLDHLLFVNADRYVPVRADGIPPGPLAPVADGVFDFRRARNLWDAADADEPRLREGDGYDHCWVLSAAARAMREPAARLVAPDAGRALEVWTNQPGVQVYTANRLDGGQREASGRRLVRHAGLCLETQHLPDSPHHPGYPSTVLRPGEVFARRTEFRPVVPARGEE